eukprot:COSAG02_NODE_9415_length_2224_cov_4.567529_2_plen_215_part_00
MAGISWVADTVTQAFAEWFTAGGMIRYKYIRSPLFVIENQYDTNQIFTQELVPDTLGDEMVLKYIVMYGEAMRNSTAQVLRNAPLTKKPQSHGLFHPSCLAHGISAALNGTGSLRILGDWFFERGKMTAFYRLVERCPASAHGLPCSPHKGCAVSGGGPSPVVPPSECEVALQHLCSGAKRSSKGNCFICTGFHQQAFRHAHCAQHDFDSFCNA